MRTAQSRATVGVSMVNRNLNFYVPWVCPVGVSVDVMSVVVSVVSSVVIEVESL